MAADTLKKHLATRLTHYLFILPFLPGIRSLLVEYRTLDLVIYLTGIVLILSLIIYGNSRPLVRIETARLSLYLSSRHTVEHHPYTGISAYKKLSPYRIRILSSGYQPVDLYLGKNDLNQLIRKLDEEGIDAE